MSTEDKNAWLESAMTRWETSLMRLCFAYLGDLSLTEDAVQETFVKAYKGFHRFQGLADEKTWLTRIAINTCKDLQKCAWFRHTDRTMTPDQLPEPTTDCTEWDDTVTRAVMALKPKYRQVVLLHYYQGLSVQEVAEVLNITRGTVHNRLKKAHEVLRQALEEWQYAE